jgi:hypothetical protein
MTVWLVNPEPRQGKGRKVASKKRKPPKGFRTWKTYMASIRPGAKKKRARKRKPAARSNPPKRKRRASKMATKRRRRTTTARKTRRRRRTYRRNPDIVSNLTKGVGNAVMLVGGKAAARIAADFVPIPQAGAMGMAVQAGVALGVGLLADAFLPRAQADYVLAGALAGPIESAVISFGVPYVSEALVQLPAAPGAAVEGYPRQLRAVGAYPALGMVPQAADALGAYGEDDSYSMMMG